MISINPPIVQRPADSLPIMSTAAIDVELAGATSANERVDASALPSPSSSERLSSSRRASSSAPAAQKAQARRASVVVGADVTAFHRDMLTDSPGIGWLTSVFCCRDNGVHPRLFDLGTRFLRWIPPVDNAPSAFRCACLTLTYFSLSTSFCF